MDGKIERRTDGTMERWTGRLAAFGIVAVCLSIVPSFHRSPDIHAEYVKYLSGKDTITAYIAYPERPTAAPGVIVIHEIFGMSDFVRQTTEQLAKDGFVAIAPDLLSRGGGTPAAGRASATRPTTRGSRRSSSATGRVLGLKRSRASAPRGSAYTPRTTRASMRDSRKRRRRSNKRGRTISTRFIRVSGTASCAPARSPRWPTARGAP